VAHIQKIKRQGGFVYRSIIERKGFKTITKVFKYKKLVIEFAKHIEGNRERLSEDFTLGNFIGSKKVCDYLQRKRFASTSIIQVKPNEVVMVLVLVFKLNVVLSVPQPFHSPHSLKLML